MLNRPIVTVLLLACCALVLAQDAADVKMPDEIIQADAQHAKAVAEADAVRLRRYERALAAVTRAGDLRTANAIQARIDAMATKPVIVTVQGSSEAWTDAIEVRAGQRVKLTAEGQWCGGTQSRARYTTGPAGMMNAAEGRDLFYLEARIGDGEPIRINAGRTITARVSGMLRFRMHDLPGGYYNNDGMMTVTVSVVQ
jgi:hypothetical protein